MDEPVIYVEERDVEMLSPKVSPRVESEPPIFVDQLNTQPKQCEDVNMDTSTTKYPYLESVKNRFEQQRKEQEDRVKVMRTKQEVELAHSKYLKKNVVDVHKMEEAKFVVDSWVNKHVGKKLKRLLRDKKFPRTEGNQKNRVLSPSYKNKILNADKSEREFLTNHISNIKNIAGLDDNVIIVSDDDDSKWSSSTSGNVGPSTEYHNRPSTSTAALSTVTDLVMKDMTDEIKDHVTCSVIGCGAVFKSKAAKNKHDENFSHSPCNPLLLNIDCELSPEEKYMCPKCCKIFKCFTGCQSHMNVLQHLSFLSPLRLGGFMCQQCLNIFRTREDCSNHIKTSKHKEVAYPFEGDIKHATQLGPAPVSLQFVKEFCGVCEAVTFEMNCVDCGVRINSPHQLTQHLRETCNRHCISASAASTQVEVFSVFLSSYYCNMCTCLCDSTKENGGLKHVCSKSHSGDIVELNCKSFSHFVTMCGIRCLRNSVTTVNFNEEDDDDDAELESLTCREILKKDKKKQMKKKTAEFQMEEDKISAMIPIPILPTMSDRKSENIPKAVQNSTSATDPFNLIQMKNILLLDLDNWPKFFQKLTNFLPDKTFVWGFYGGANDWKEPVSCPPFEYQKNNGRFHLHDRCGESKDAADIAICMTVGKLDVSLPKDVSFTILSGDKGFHEIERQLRNSQRKAVVIDPHDAQKFSADMILSMVTSVSEK